MSDHAWIAMCVVATVTGGVFGWYLRIAVLDDRKESAWVDAMIAKRNYYNTEAETMIAEAQAKINREKEKDNGGK